MNDILNSILDLDRISNEKIEQAKEDAAKIVSDAKAEESRLLRESRRSMIKQEKGDRRRENKLTSERLAVIESERDEKIAQLEAEYSENMEKWADQIFQKIISD